MSAGILQPEVLPIWRRLPYVPARNPDRAGARRAARQRAEFGQEQRLKTVMKMGSMELQNQTEASPVMAFRQFKPPHGALDKAAHSTGIREQLGSGHGLDGTVKSRMESAFGHDFSRVQIHTDTKAAAMASQLGARAFTIGTDVAFSSGQYQPGTLIGDALIAHELAHVVQQSDGLTSVAPEQTGDTSNNRLEGDADKSAVSTVVSLWGGAKGAAAKIARNARPSLKSGLRLQRCAGELVPLTTPDDFQFKVVSGNWKVACYSPTFRAVGWSLECNYEVGVPLENHQGPVSDALAQHEAYISAGLAAQATLGAMASVSGTPPRPPKSVFCEAYQAAMDKALKIAIPGAKVSKFHKYCP